jgi:hypothetical protein
MRSILLFAMLVFLADVAWAGDAPPASPGPNSTLLRPALIARVERAGRLRVEGAWGAAVLTSPHLTAAGFEYLRARPSDLTRWLSDLPRPVPLRDIRSIQVRVGSARRGAIAGALAFALVTWAAVKVVGQAESGVDEPQVLLATVPLAALWGAGGGALIGMVVRRWQTVYVRPSP